MGSQTTMVDEDKLYDALTKNAKILQKVYDNLEADDESRSKAVKQLEKDFDSAARNLKGLSLRDVETDVLASSKAITGAFSEVSKKFGVIGGLIGGSVGAFVNAAVDMTGAFRSMSDVGQTFGGSMLKMSVAAAEAGLPLDEFAKAVTKNATVIATMGSKSFFDLSLNVRKSAEQFGMFGLTTEQMTDYLGDYLETMRLQGVIQNHRDKVNGDGFIKFAKNMTEMAGLFGKSRDAIMKQTMEASKNVLLTSRLAQTAGANQENLSRNVTNAIAMFASIPGAAGDALSNLLSETAGSGTALFSEYAKPFIESGLGNFVDMFEKYARQAADGMDIDEFAQANNEMMAEIDRNTSQLRLLAMNGDANARQILAMRAQMRKLDQQDIDERKRKLEEEQKSQGFLNVFASLESAVKRAFGAFKLGFLTPFEKFSSEGGMKDFSDTLEKIGKRLGVKLTAIGTRLGTMLMRVFDEDNLENIFQSLETMASVFGFVGDIVMRIFQLMTSETVTTAFTTFTNLMSDAAAAISWLGNIIGKLGSMIYDKLVPSFGEAGTKFENILGQFIGAVVAGIVLFKMFRGVIGGVKNAFSAITGLNKQNDATITARNATIYVKNGSGPTMGGGRNESGLDDILADGNSSSGTARTSNSRNAGRRRWGKWGRRAGLAGLGIGAAGLTMLGSSAMAAETSDDGGDGSVTSENGGGGAEATSSGMVDALDTALMAGGFATTVASILGKKIPGVSAAIGAAEAAALAARGDNVGAALAGASGVAATIPVAGTVASLLIDGVSLARDQIGHEVFDAVTVNAANAVGGAMADAASAVGDGLSSAWDWLTKPSKPTSTVDIAAFTQNIKENQERDETRTQELAQRLDALKVSIEQMTEVTSRLQAESNQIAKQNVIINQQIAETAGAMA